MDRKKQEVPFDFAQGRFSATLPSGSTAGRDGRDDIFVKVDDIARNKSQPLPRQAGAGRVTIVWDRDEEYPKHVRANGPG